MGDEHQLNVPPESVVVCELGTLGVRVDGALTEVRGDRAAVLIAALVLAGAAGMTNAALIDIVWPEDEQPASARQSLANIAMRLRRAYGATFIESTTRGYRIGRHVGSDRHQFVTELDAADERLADDPHQALRLVEAALVRWRGDPWHGLEQPMAVEADRARLHETRLRARRIRITALRATDRQDLALRDLRSVVEADPFDEALRHQLVEVLIGLGHRAAAVRVIQEAHRAFAQRGLVPDASLVAIEQSLLSDDFMFDAPLRALPQIDGEFVGREKDVDELISLLDDHRLVTLHGPGGSGKTRLAVQAMATRLATTKRGFVDLVTARSGRDVDMAFAKGLGLEPERMDGLTEAECRRLLVTTGASTGNAVLVVDNCEHVVEHVSAVVSSMLGHPGRVRILATSRVPLAIAHERRLAIPTYLGGPELFAIRAAQHGVHIDVDEQADAVVEICDAVDRLPLAIEIAAAQTPTRTLLEIADELGRGAILRDITQSSVRHETIAATVRWSHELLEQEVSDAFIRLGVFTGEFERRDADAVMAKSAPTVALDVLVRSSLVERSEHEGSSRYRLAVPVQQYCAAELRHRGTADEVGVALGDWLLDFTDRPHGDVWRRFSVVDEVECRFSHALTAVDAFRRTGQIDRATLLAARLGGAAMLYGRSGQLLELLSELWPSCDDPHAVADALLAVAHCAEVERDITRFAQALGLLDALDGPAGRRHRVEVHCLNSLWIMWAARLSDENYELANAELRRARESVGPDSPIDRAMVNMWQSAVRLLEGDWHGAERSAARALDDSAGTLLDIDATACLCHALLQRGNPSLAMELADCHPDRHRRTLYGSRLGIASVIARVRCGEIDAGLTELAQLHNGACRASIAVGQDDTAVAVADVAHVLGHTDLARQVLDTGVVGRGPWVGYLVPKICHDLGIPVTGHYSRSASERDRRSGFYGSTASAVLDELHRRSGSGTPTGGLPTHGQRE